jgi:hypothetical protein
VSLEEDVRRQAEEIRKLKAMVSAVFTACAVLNLSVELAIPADDLVERFDSISLFHGWDDQTREEAKDMLRLLVSSG